MSSELMRKMKSDIVKEGYTRIAEKYHNQRRTYPSSQLLKKFSKQLKKGSKVLDMGCGAGVPVTKFLVSSGYKATGIDFARGMVKLAKKNVPKARFFQMDITKMTFGPNSFDGAISFYAIIHIPREKHSKIYKNLHKMLKPGAIILVNACGGDKWEGYSKNYLGVPMFWSHYGPKKTANIIKQAGFGIKWQKTLRIGGESQFWVLASNSK